MGTQARVLHNSGCEKRGNSRHAEALKLAASIARQLAIVATWPNVQIIRLAIESEADYRLVPLAEAAALIVECASVHLERGVLVNRFYFEDAKWRSPFVGLSKAEIASLKNRMAAEVRKQKISEAFHRYASLKCHRCEDTGEIWNSGPGPRRISCPDCRGVAR